jgi:hypothetical protein
MGTKSRESMDGRSIRHKAARPATITAMAGR